MRTRDVHTPAELHAAARVAEPGDRIRIAPGLYAVPTDVIECKGCPEAPVVFEPLSDGVISGGRAPNFRDGRGLPFENGPGNPGWHDFAFLRFEGCEHIEIRGLEVEGCWPTIFYLRACEHVVLSGLKLRHGTNAIFARDCRDILCEKNRWQQDDSKKHDLWHTIDWLEAHGGDGGNGTKRHFNGSFFAAKSTSSVTIRKNRIADCYNGIRMKVDAPPTGGDPALNAHVRILDNDFIRVRDNPIEAEVYAYDWHVAWNRIVDAHAWFSFDGCQGGYFYIYGNTARFETRQGEPIANSHTMGRVLKLSYRLAGAPVQYGAAVPQFPWYVFNNSFVLRCPIVGGGAERLPQPPDTGIGPDFTAHLGFINNAFEWCSQEVGIWVCEWIEMLRNFETHADDGVRFDASLTNRQDYIDQARSLEAGEGAALHTAAPLFAKAAKGDFALVADSPGRGSAELTALAAPNGETYAIRPNADGSLHRGAVQDYGFVSLTGSHLDDADPPAGKGTA